MIGRVLTLAERDWLAQVRAPAFWIALLAVQALVGLGAFGLALALRPPVEIAVTLHADDPALAAAGARALEAARAAGEPLTSSASGAGLNVRLSPGLAAAFYGSERGAAALRPHLRRELERLAQAQALERLGVSPAEAARALAEADAVSIPVPPPSPALRPERLAGAGLAVLLWIQLVLGLGMLLQAAAQERANRSLEMLLAAAGPAEIVLGKLLGVGATLATHAAASIVVGAGVSAGAFGIVGVPLAGLGAGFDPGVAALTAEVFAAAFAMYGTVLVSLGVLARDFPSAEALARPMFAGLVLIAALIGVQAVAPGAAPDALTWLPPLTPFQLLLRAPGGLDPTVLAGGLALQIMVAIAALACARPLFARALTGAWPKRIKLYNKQA